MYTIILLHIRLEKNRIKDEASKIKTLFKSPIYKKSLLIRYLEDTTGQHDKAESLGKIKPQKETQLSSVIEDPAQQLLLNDAG